MKRWGLMCLLVLLLAGCQKVQPQVDWEKRALELVGKSFETTVQLTYGEISATMELKRELPDGYTILFHSPPSLEGIQLEAQGEDLLFRYGEMELASSWDQMPAGAVVKVLREAIQAVESGENLQTVPQDSTVAISGRLDSGDFTLTVDGESGAFLSMTALDGELTLTFEDFSY